jgi:hypothetical protein
MPPPTQTNPPSSSSSSIANSAQQSHAQAQATVQSGGDTYRLPTEKCMQHVFKLAIVEDKPIMMDYWTSSVDKTVVIGVRENNEKLIVKSADEYTSPIAKIYKVETEYIIVTENSIYIVSSDIANKRIS